MTEEIMLTEELFLEFLDPVSAKAYTWKQETESGYASLKFQASFEDDQEKRYYLSFYRDSGFGKNSRRVIFSVKKNKNLNPKIHVDKGSFIKILGTIIQIYQHYKLNDPDGKMSNSYAFQFPDTFAKYMPFLVKVNKRLFKTTPKLRLGLYGAVESLDGNTIIYFANTTSSMPLFGGPKADLALIRGDFYMKLSGDTAADKGDEEKEIITAKAPAEPAPYISPYSPPPYSPKAKVEPAKVKKTKATTVTPAKVVPVEEPVKAAVVSPSFVKPNYEDPGLFKSKGNNNPSKAIYATKDSGSSSLTKGQTAEILGLYSKERFIEYKDQFGINAAAIKKISDSSETYVLVVKAKNGKYVAFPVGSDVGNTNYINDKFYFIETSEAPKVEVPVVTKKDLEQYATNPTALFVTQLPESFEKILDEASFNLGPIKVNLSQDTSIIGVADKLEEVRQFFGTLPKNLVQDKIHDIQAEVDKVTTKLTKSLNAFFSEEKLFLGDKDGEYTDYINSVKIYTGSGYELINNFLRNKVEVSGNTELSLQNRVENIDDAFRKEGVRLPIKLVVYRGASASLDQINAMNEAKSIPLTGYASVSLRPTIGLSFMGSGHYFTELLLPVISKNDPTNTDPIQPANFSSNQGNKILYSINHLDRCLSLLLKKISNHPNEEEILLNRGTEVRSRPGTKIQRVLKKASGDPDSGIWMARVEIAPKAISESSLKSYLLREALDRATEALDSIALTSFFLEDYAEFVSE